MRSIGEAVLSALSTDDSGMDRREAALIADICERAAQRRAAALEIAVPYARKLIDKAKAGLQWAYEHCDSPIERRLLPALVFANYGEGFASFPAQVHLPKLDAEPPLGDLVIVPQFAFIKYRLDFAIVAEAEGRRKFVAVECDGQDYHKNADKDRARDEYLKAFGFDVFRFNGPDIQADPLTLATKVGMHLADWRASL